MASVRQSAKWVSRDAGEPFTYEPEDALVPREAKPGDERGDAVARLVRSAMPDDGQEHLVAVALDAHGVPLAFSRVATGSVDQCPLFARDVYAWALTVPCVRFVGVAHNHPSGAVTPSGPDVAGTALVAKVGAMLALDVAWSMVVTHEGPAWALVPMKGKAPEQGEREPYQPKDPDEDGPEPDEDGEDEPEDGGEEPEESPDGEPDGPEDDGEEDEPGEDEDEPEEPGEPEPGEDPEAEAEAPTGEPSDNPDAPPARTPESTPSADVEALRAAVKAAFRLQ